MDKKIFWSWKITKIAFFSLFAVVHYDWVSKLFSFEGNASIIIGIMLHVYVVVLFAILLVKLYKFNKNNNIKNTKTKK